MIPSLVPSSLGGGILLRQVRHYCRRRLCAVLVLSLLLLPTQTPGKEDPAQPQYYTIQAATTTDLATATQIFAKLRKSLPPELQTGLRVEKIAAFYTIRLGQEREQNKAAARRQALPPSTGKVVMMQAYILDERIVERLDSQNEKKIASAVPRVPVTPKPAIPIPRPVAPAPSLAPATLPPSGRSEPGTSLGPATGEETPRREPTRSQKAPARDEQKKARWEEIAAAAFSFDPALQKTFAHREKADFATRPDCLAGGCHERLAAGTNVHQPVAKALCAACHEGQGQGHPNAATQDFSLRAKGAQLCHQCHETAVKADSLHAPFKEGNCLACHDPHGSGEPALLKSGQDQKPMCFTCHDAAMARKAYGHGPVNLGTCSYCHHPHGSREPKLLRTPIDALCIHCHSDFQKGAREAKYMHSAIESQSCVACHRPHGAERPALLEQDMQSLCSSCHKRIQVAGQKTPHPALTQGRGCGNCHNIHYSDYPALMLKPESEACLDCHGQDEFSRAKTRVNIKKVLQDKKYLHGPVAQKSCSGCHNPHGSDNGFLLTGPYPDTVYAAYTPGLYDFCFGCHDARILQAATTDTATGFRNGKTNLHYLHVAREEKGRTCRACHDPHASDTKSLINKEGVPFGNWRIPMQFMTTDQGGSCAPGCHQRYEYNRLSPIDYAKKK